MWEEEPSGDHPEDQSRSGQRNSLSASLAEYRRDHHRRLHRHGPPDGPGKVSNALQEALRRDKQKTNILKISELGLVQMTRKRTRESLTRTLCEQCPYCEGKGFVKSLTTVCFEILRSICRDISDEYSSCIRVTAHPEVVKLLFEQESDQLEDIQKKYNTKIQLNPDPNLFQEQYEIVSC